jgi:hypothetical protein
MVPSLNLRSLAACALKCLGRALNSKDKPAKPVSLRCSTSSLFCAALLCRGGARRIGEMGGAGGG